MIWIDTKEKFEQFIMELHLKHPFIKFDYKTSAKEVDFLDTTLYIDNNNRLQTKLYKKPTDRQNYLHRKSEHPESLKKNIPYSQALRIKRIWSNEEEFKNSCKALKKRFVPRGYDKQETEQQTTRASEIPCNKTLQPSVRKQSKRIPFVVTFNRTLPPTGKILNQTWHILKLNKHLKHLFQQPPVITYRRCKNIRELICSNRLQDDKVLNTNKKSTAKGCKPCLGKTGILCAQQV